MKVDEITIDTEALEEIAERVKTYTLADAIREGSLTTKKAIGWGDGENTACALGAAIIAAEKRGII
jgi:hypothetical protein